jgi:hypothetical protein
MTYEELIAMLDDLDIALSNGFGKASTFIACTKAVRKVLELHKNGNGQASKCEACYLGFDCPTLEAIESELNNG